jgi:protoheme IX farnesyltransferase
MEHGMAEEADSPAMMGENRAPQGEITVARVARHRILFERFAWFALAYTTLTILFGSFVRASLSGDGCGTSWPLCGGSLLPQDAAVKTYIEFTHRLTSGLTLVVVFVLYIGARLIFPRGATARRAAGLSVIFTLVSALIGALLVLAQWVVHDTSIGRVITMPMHLINTLLLLGNLLVAAVMARSEGRLGWKGAGAVGGTLKAAMGGMAVLGVTGAISAMGKTAYGSEMAAAGSFMDRMRLHLGPDAHPLLRGGISHPLVATSVAILILWACHYAAEKRPSAKIAEWSRIVSGLLIIQFGFGLANLMMSAPPAMQILHLLLAIGNWLSLVMLTIHVLRESASDHVDEPAAAPREKAPFMHLVKDYVALTKPRVISLLLFTTVAAMVIARGSWPQWWLVLSVSVAGYMIAGSANTWNMIIEQDLDLAMERTAGRPIVGGRITPGQAALFATALAVGSFVILAWTANVLSALLGWAGLAFYVLIYTLVLKRRTWQNIVIGGAAGAFPPLVGYAAVTNELSPFAWFLFWLIVLWTPVHFWALAILIKDDYAKAGVPMLPVVKGERATVIQIVFYAGLTALVSIIPFVQREVGMIYMIGAGLLNLLLFAQSWQLLRHTDRPNARALFKYSMAYLALMFVVMAVDRGVESGARKGIHLQTMSTMTRIGEEGR